MPILGIALSCTIFFGCDKPLGSEDSDVASVSKAMEKIETAYYEGGDKVESVENYDKAETGSSFNTIAKSMKLSEEQYIKFNSRYKSARDISGGYDVGVIPTNQGCPLNSELVKIYLDNDDGNSKTSESGSWNSSWQVLGNAKNTHMYFCKADGRLFSNSGGTFSVLKLGWNKPDNVQSLTNLFIDCEDTGGQSKFEPGFSDGAPNYFSNQNLMSYWYVFNNYNSTNAFPDLGMQYGVLGTPANEISSSIFYTDDEDNANGNWIQSTEVVGGGSTGTGSQIGAVGMYFEMGQSAAPYFFGAQFMGNWGGYSAQGTKFRLARVK